MNAKKILYTVLAAWIVLYLFGMVSFLVEKAQGHEYGHAEGIKHLTGHTTPVAARKNYVGCTGQNKLVGHYDLDKDGVFDMCITMWQEHDEMHVIASKPDMAGKCECEGYLWLEGDSQW